jgi:hypothetical protein
MISTYYALAKVIAFDNETGHNTIDLDGDHLTDLPSAVSRKLRPGDFVMLWRRDADTLIIIGKVQKG